VNIYIDLGSSTVKTYLFDNNYLTLLDAKSFDFKTGFSVYNGISPENKKLLFALINETKSNYPEANVNVFATALFRKILPDYQKEVINEFLVNTGTTLNILSHEEESEYLELALLGNYTRNDNVLLINIGGGSTELIVMQNKYPLEKHNLNIGVGTLLQEYPSINSIYSEIPLVELVDNIESRLPIMHNFAEIAFYTGGELTYMTIAGYRLNENNLFIDPSHPNIITHLNFYNKNEEIFSKIKLIDLEMLMPENPKWMLGARACSAIAQAIVSKYQVKTIIPSNSNLIDGIVRKQMAESR